MGESQSRRGADIICWRTKCPRQHKALVVVVVFPQSLDGTVRKAVLRAGHNTNGTKTRGHGRPSAWGENSRAELWSKDVKSFWTIPQIKHTSTSAVANHTSSISHRNEKRPSFFCPLHLSGDWWNTLFWKWVPFVMSHRADNSSSQLSNNKRPSLPLRPDFFIFAPFQPCQRFHAAPDSAGGAQSILMGGCKQRANYVSFCRPIFFLIINSAKELHQTWKTGPSLSNEQQRLWWSWQVSIRSPLGAGERATSILHDTMTQTTLQHKWAILCVQNKSLAYKQGSIFTPERTQTPGWRPNWCCWPNYEQLTWRGC